MNLFERLPTDITIKIYQFDPTHRELFRNCFTDIQVQGTLSRAKNLSRLYRNDLPSDWIGETRSNYLCLPDLLSVTVNDHDYMVKQLDKCKCCLRHQDNRPPDILHSNLGTKKVYPYHMRCNCKCMCRHFSRQLVSSFWRPPEEDIRAWDEDVRAIEDAMAADEEDNNSMWWSTFVPLLT